MDNQVIDVEKIEKILDDGINRAQKVLTNDKDLKELLDTVKAQIDAVPILKSTIQDGQTLFELIQSYAKKEYTEVSPKVIAIVVSAFLYVIKKKDLIKDSIPVLGWLDDVAIVAVALKAIEPELKAYKTWKEKQTANK
ncbi:MAG: DUF1232 domain-containing protein [Solobacterium sp.]|nr:DUF1232 domain-containing protein [Solobacterium sp.]